MKLPYHKKINFCTAIFLAYAITSSCNKISDDQVVKSRKSNKIAFDINKEYSSNPFTDKKIEQSITFNGDTLKVGKKTAYKFREIDPDSILPANNITDKIEIDTIEIESYSVTYDFNSNYFIVPKDSLIDETKDWIDTTQKLITDFGDTLITNEKFKVEIRKLNVEWPKPIKIDHLIPVTESDYDVGILDINNGLLSSKINRVRTDLDGNIWIASRAGLSMYDGEHLFNFDRTNGLPSEIIYMVHCDQKNRIWFTTLDGDLLFIENGIFYELDNTFLGGLTIYEISDDQDGSLWLSTEGLGLLYFDGEQFTRLGFEEGLIDETMSTAQDTNGNLWISTFGYGLIKWNGQEANYYTTENGLIDDYGSKVLVAKDQSVWWATDYGLVKIKGDTIWNIGEEEGLELNYCFDLAEDEEGRIWFTADVGFGYIEENKIVHASYATVKKEKSTNGITIDNFNNKWIGTSDGLYKLNTTSFFNPLYSELVSKINLTSIHSVEDTIYMGSEDGNLYKYFDNKVIEYRFPEPYNELAISEFDSDNKGNLWFCAYKHIVKYDGENFYSYSEDQGFFNTSKSDLFVDTDGTVYFASWEGLFKLTENELAFLGEEEGLPYSYIYNVNSIDNQIWFTHGLGISVLEKDSMYHYITENGIASKPRNAFKYKDKLIFSHIFDGIDVIENDSLFWLNKGNYLISNHIWLSFIVNHQYWVFTNKGCQIFDLNSNFGSFISIDIHNGLKTNSILNANYNPKNDQIQLINDGKLLLANRTDFVLSSFDKPTIKYFEVNDKQYYNDSLSKTQLYPVNQNLDLQSNQNSLIIHYGRTINNGLSEAHYSYRLRGLENNWSKPTQESKVSFLSLPHGSYTFEVRLKDMLNNSWSEAVTLQIKILPPWYQTKWSYVLYFILFVIIILMIIKWRTHSLIQKQKRLKSEVEKATSTIRKQKDELEVRNEEILDSIKYAKRLQEAVLPPQKLVKEWLTNSFILYKPKEIVSGDFYWMENAQYTKDDKKYSIVLFAVADCTGHGVPGAMVSVVCAGALNRAINEYKLNDVGEILDKVSELVVASLNKNKSDVKDGMDIALCGLDIGNKILYASGANNPIWIVSKSTEIESTNGLRKFSTPNNSNCNLFELKGLKQPIGLNDRNENFETAKIQLKPGDAIYLFSDGYADQFGGEKGKKFKYNNFRNLLMTNYDKEMTEQRNVIEEVFENWKGTQEQIDDVCVIGVKINGKERNNFTARELEVLEFLAEGMPSKLIADKMNISIHTVNTYRRRILSKTNCYNTTELVNYAKSKEII